ncbi:patatin-like phospholipase family protein [Histidinibacterium aquaticum]|uniref:Patatin-like phospholipase family protein n=1 Tax=Histidinibacterium aquaticum TaxID=2613962 RepID=A0A5J5GCY4_9RHOB|nr:patatin-like phospholipase family protein [Histidinibacterium aquaticum]KAA9005294.1 patatin-like phospholipase family protein [Histidinibacterium aquaticum]
MSRESPFDQLVFSGGGLRCFWQGGFVDVVRDEIGLDPKRIASVSGGALSAAGFICRRGKMVLDVMMERFAEADSNIAWDTYETDGMTPHQRIYREVVERVIDVEARQIISDGPSYQVLIGHPPSHGWSKATGTAATLAYEAELHTVSSPHMSLPEKFGVSASLVDAREAAREGTLTDLICAAATIPPVFDPPMWHGKPVIDGGMFDQAPFPDPDEGRTLIMLTRRYRNVPEAEGRVYLPPEQACPADKIDFTDPEKLRATWACGEEDGRRWLKDRN